MDSKSIAELISKIDEQINIRLNVTHEELFTASSGGRGRTEGSTKEATNARQVYYYILSRYYRWSMENIGSIFKRSAMSISSSLRTIENQPELIELAAEIYEDITGSLPGKERVTVQPIEMKSEDWHSLSLEERIELIKFTVNEVIHAVFNKN